MVRLNIPAQHCFRDLALAAVLAAIDAEESGLAPDVRDEIISAVNEAFNNVVLHAYKGIRGGTIDIQVEARPGEVEIQVCDRGRSFDPEIVPAYVEPHMADWDLDELGIEGVGQLALDQLAESGMGLFIMRSFMDEVSYASGSGGKPNILVLRKKWPLGRTAPRSYDAEAPKKETSQSGWRMRSVAVPAYGLSTAGSLKQK